MKVTCRQVAVGDTILCRDWYWSVKDSETFTREVLPMTVARIEERRPAPGDPRVTYYYYDADGTYITYAGGATRVRKVVP